MADLPTHSQSLWLETEADYFAPLDRDISVDVAIVGGGLAGISIAWMLKNEGLRVAVLEADDICQGTTGHSTAKITSQHDLIYAHIVDTFGWEKAQQYADANQKAIEVMADIVQQQNIDCDFQWRDAYVYTQRQEYVEKIQREAELAKDLGIDVTYVESIDLPFSIRAGMQFGSQAQFHPRKYVLDLAAKIPGDGSHVFAQTKVVDIAPAKICTITTANGNLVRADKVVVASHFPCHDSLGFYFARMYAQRSYLLATEVEGDLPQGMYVTAESPGRTIRTQDYRGQQLLLVGGEHHQTGKGPAEQAHYEVLRDFAQQHFPLSRITHKWSAQDYTTMDKLPYIGHIRAGVENVFVATGFRKWGITTSTVAALTIRDLITWGNNPWQEVFSPQRSISLDSLGEAAKINFQVATELVKGKIKRTDQGEVGRGEAKVLNIDGHRTGVYRDEQGQLHSVDITCTHVGCELKWNSGEKTWDCPCHGSRFGYDGKVIQGPAFKPLQPVANKIDLDLV